jgi:peptide subunit release factor 1 (eRF1)
MNTNLNSQLPATHSFSSEGTLVGVFGAALLLARKLFSPKAAKPEFMSRADFYAELLALKDQMHTDYLALLVKLDANHRELLAVLERQATRINALEAGLARVDERTTKGGRASS